MSVTSVECRYPISIHLHLHRQTYSTLPPLAFLITNTWLSCQVTLRTFQSSRPMGMLTLPNKKDSTERNWWMFQPITFSWLDRNLRCFFLLSSAMDKTLHCLAMDSWYPSLSNVALVTCGNLLSTSVRSIQLPKKTAKGLSGAIFQDILVDALLKMVWKCHPGSHVDSVVIFCCWSEDI